MALFEDYAGRIPQVNKALKEYGFAEGEEGLNQARKLCQDRGFDPYEICQSTQQNVLKMQNGLMYLALQLQLKKQKKLVTKPVLQLLQISVKDFRPSVCQVL